MMTIEEVLTKLRKADPEAPVYFDFCHCVPTTVDSWRGVYMEPALGWSATGYSINVSVQAPTVSDVIQELEKAINGTEYTGWKGGTFMYSGADTLHIDNPGDYTNTEISGIEIGDWSVLLHTRQE